MAKTGNAYLRTALYRMAIVGIRQDPTIRAHYARKRAGQVEDECSRPLHEEGARDRLGRLAQRRGTFATTFDPRDLAGVVFIIHRH